MSLGPLVAVACCFAGAVSGATSGARHSFLLSVVGAVLGFIIGIGSFFALVIPYVLSMIQMENRPRVLKLWQYLFLPLMASTLIMAVLISWYTIGSLL
jgi:hypothetical protein